MDGEGRRAGMVVELEEVEVEEEGVLVRIDGRRETSLMREDWREEAGRERSAQRRNVKESQPRTRDVRRKGRRARSRRLTKFVLLFGRFLLPFQHPQPLQFLQPSNPSPVVLQQFLDILQTRLALLDSSVLVRR